MKRRDLVKLLRDHGYRSVRDDGDHEIFQAPGRRPVQVPRPRELNENTAKAILKQAGLR